MNTLVSLKAICWMHVHDYMNICVQCLYQDTKKAVLENMSRGYRCAVLTSVPCWVDKINSDVQKVKPQWCSSCSSVPSSLWSSDAAGLNYPVKSLCSSVYTALSNSTYSACAQTLTMPCSVKNVWIAHNLFDIFQFYAHQLLLNN